MAFGILTSNDLSPSSIRLLGSVAGIQSKCRAQLLEFRSARQVDQNWAIIHLRPMRSFGAKPQSFRLLYNLGKSLQIIKNLLLVFDTLQRIYKSINAQRCPKSGTPNASRGRKTTICCGRPPGDQLSNNYTTARWST